MRIINAMRELVRHTVQGVVRHLGSRKIGCLIAEAYQDFYYWVAEKTSVCLPWPFSSAYRFSYLYLGIKERADYWLEWCDGCNKELQGAGESFMLKDSVWKTVRPDGGGHYCVDCFERRLGRKLNSDDFGDCYPLPTDSKTLKSRMSNPKLTLDAPSASVRSEERP